MNYFAATICVQSSFKLHATRKNAKSLPYDSLLLLDFECNLRVHAKITSLEYRKHVIVITPF